MISIVCIIPTCLRKKSLTTLRLLIKSLRNSSEGILKVKLEFVTTNSLKIDGFRSFLYDIGIKSDEFAINQCKKTAGFSEMNNLVFTKYVGSSPDYFLLVNDDVWVNQDFFKNFLKMIKKKSVDIVAPLLIDANILYTQKQVVIDSYGVEYFKSGYAKNSTGLDNKTQLATAACLFLSGRAVESMRESYGFVFNDFLYFYLEDVEFSIRARMLNFAISKVDTMIAYHFGSTTSGKKSYFTMYQTYRNILWLIILTWPTKFIIRNSINIFIVQVWVILYSIKSFGIRMYLKIILDTLINFKQLKVLRNKTIKNYKRDTEFGLLFSDLLFRTYHGIKIKAI